MVVSVPTGVAVLGIVALLLVASSLAGALIGPTPGYELTDRNELPPNDSERFLQVLEALSDAQVNKTGSLEVLTNGPSFYPAELDAIRNATQSVNIEAYIFQKGNITNQYISALAERARAGVRVNLVLDAFGSAGTTKLNLKKMVEAVVVNSIGQYANSELHAVR